MSDLNPIDRVRKRTEGGREPFESNRETFSEKQAKLEREAPDANKVPDTEEGFVERMSEKLADNEDDTTSSSTN